MKAEEFVKEYMLLCPDKKNYEDQGLSEGYIERVMASYSISSRNAPDAITGDELYRLVKLFDVTKTEIGMVTFHHEWPQIDDRYLFVGSFEADYLVVDLTDKMIKWLEFPNLHVMCSCASSGDKFLSALLIAAPFMERCAYEEGLGENQELILTVAEECAEIAGGEMFLDFYKVLLGSDL